MPDRRTHRGPHPADYQLFAPAAIPTLRAAGHDYCWLLDHGYPQESSLKLVGDRYELAARQRIAISRSSCSAEQAKRRQSRQVPADQLPGAVLWLDGYNVLTTVEAALGGGLILLGRDGAYRDMASMHGSYRKVAETLPALRLIGETLVALNCRPCRWLLDRPVSNSGRLKKMIEAVADEQAWPWRAELVPNPDALLVDSAVSPGATRALLEGDDVVAATADSAILDACPAWFNLARETVARHVPDARVLELAGVY